MICAPFYLKDDNNMMKVAQYDEQHDMFIIEPDNGQEFPIDAGALASVLGRFDEPHTFIGLRFDVRVIE